MLSLIVAIAQNNAIGKDNQLLWHISEDLKYFKRTTLGCPVIMGRKTWESLPFKPLPKRENIIISTKDIAIEGATVVNSIEEAVEYSKRFENSFIIGGGIIYKTMMPYCDKLYITRVFKDFEADTFFEEIDLNVWEIENESERMKDENNGLEFQFLIYKKR